MLHKSAKHNRRTSRSRSPSIATRRTRSHSRARWPEQRSGLRLSKREEREVEKRAEKRGETLENREPLLLDPRHSRPPYVALYERPPDICRPIGLVETRSVVGRNNNTLDDRRKYRHSTGSEIYDPPESYKFNTSEIVSRHKDNSQGSGAGASFKVGWGSHNLFGGIHFNKDRLAKRFSLSETKNQREDPLAYGSFNEDHLAYPDPPSSRGFVVASRRESFRQESSRQKPNSVSHESKSILKTQSHNYDAATNSVDISQRMQSLQVSDEHYGRIGAGSSLASAPGSPLLESYRGTYQSISPMPSPLLKAMHLPTLSNLETNYHCSSADERSQSSSSKNFRRTARFHDPKEEAKILAKALKGERNPPDTTPLISILPGLTHTQILELRFQYKQLVRTGKDKKGVNLAKHIKLRLKDQQGLMKACYACALGQWESEAYWANYWYQSQKSRRELLIESLMGRTNEEIRFIKDGFRDKKYQNSLTRCLQTELREDKFKKAVMLVLEEKRMVEHLEGSVDKDLVASDVLELRSAVKQKRGGESAVMKIVILRSETHLRELLKAYNLIYEGNFAKEILKKSENLVGELLAHILNGVINAPVRDARLLNHALTLPRTDSVWYDLLISRLIRYHWDRPHFERIRSEFRHLYNVELQNAVTEGVSRDLGLFLEALCVRRTEGDVRVLPPS